MSTDRRGALRLAWRSLLGRDLRYRAEIDVPYALLGSEYGAHAVSPLGLGPDSVVYSVGVGEDASFDIALIERFGLTVHAFDPTPRSIAWCQAQDFPAAFELHPWGLAAHDGVARFTPPVDPTHISHRLSDDTNDRGEGEEGGETLEFPVRTLATVMDELGHERLDVLKMDIEGAEYEVLEQLDSGRLAIDQILVEFHHQFASVPLQRTKDAVDRLRAAGYRIFRVSTNGREYSFIHPRAVDSASSSSKSR